MSSTDTCGEQQLLVTTRPYLAASGDLRDVQCIPDCLADADVLQLRVLHVADEVCVMYLGQIVERGDTGTVTGAPAHPYTRALLALAPDPERSSRIARRRLLIPGEISSPDAPPAGCRFHPRCAYSQEICRRVAPVLAPAGNAGSGHVAACHFAEEILSGELAPRGSEPQAAARCLQEEPERRGPSG